MKFYEIIQENYFKNNNESLQFDFGVRNATVRLH